MTWPFSDMPPLSYANSKPVVVNVISTQEAA